MILKRFSSLSLAVQSFTLIGILIAGEISFILLLCWQLHQAELEIARETRLKELLRNSQKLVYLLSDYEQTLEVWVSNQDPVLEKASLGYEKQMMQVTTWLNKHSENNPDLHAQIEHLTDLQNRMFKVVHRAKKRFSSLEDRTQMMVFAGAVFTHILKLRNEWEKGSVSLLDDFESILKTYPEIEAKRRRQLELISWYGVTGNIIIVLALALYFVRTIVSRLLVMADNTNRLSNKQPMNALVQGTDEIAQLDHAMHEMADAIEEQQKERQAFLAMVSHELRTPLNSIRGSIELLSMGVAGKISEDAGLSLSESDQHLDRLLAVINDLLDLEKMEAGKLVLDRNMSYLEFSLSKALEQVQAFALERGTTISLPETNVELSIDADRVTQVIRALLLNAIMYSPISSAINIEVAESSEFVEVKIVDNGPGIPDELQVQLFERFRKLPGSNDTIARGMGLPIAKQIVQAHGGGISYVPNPAGGSILSFTLPK